MTIAASAAAAASVVTPTTRRIAPIVRNARQDTRAARAEVGSAPFVRRGRDAGERDPGTLGARLERGQFGAPVRGAPGTQHAISVAAVRYTSGCPPRTNAILPSLDGDDLVFDDEVAIAGATERARP